MHAPEDSSTPLKILCLDGGGVRGLSSLLILDKLMESLQIKLKLANPPLPCEIFDLICGTSTGGLIALMLGRLRMSVRESIDAYGQLSEDVFKSTVSFPLLKRLRGEAMYDASRLEKCIKDVCRKHGGSENAPLQDPLNDDKGLCRVFVVAVTQANAEAQPRLFRSYATQWDYADRCDIWEAARSTTAATTFFDPMKVGSPPETLIDGGLSGGNNPSKLALQEVRNLFPGRPIDCFLSVGTGIGKVVHVSAGFAGIAKACARLMTDCEVTANDVGKEFFEESRKNGEPDPYFRLSVAKGLDNIQLDEWRELEILVDVTSAYLRSGDPESRIRRCANVLSKVNEVQEKNL